MKLKFVAALATASFLFPAAHASAATPESACAAAFAKSVGKCVKKVIATHASCYKKTGSACASTDEKLTKAYSSANSGTRGKCENDAAVAGAGYGPLTPLQFGFFAGDQCKWQASSVVERSFGELGLEYGDASDDNRKCMLTAAKTAGKYLSSALGDIAKCAEAGCSFDFTEDATAASTYLTDKCPAVTLPRGDSIAQYVAATTSQIRTAVQAPCDPINTGRCAFPFPNDYFSVAGAGTDSGRRVAIGRHSMPATEGLVYINTARWNEADGFSSGPMILLSDPNIDLTETGAAPITDIAQSLDADAPMFVMDAETGEKQLMFWERDTRGASAADQPIIGRTMKNLKEGHRYIVVLRNIKGAGGAAQLASAGFALYRDMLPSTVLPITARRPHMEDIFTILTSFGVTRSELYLAWDFTTQSSSSVSRRLLEMRDDAFTTLGAAAPSFTVNTVTEPLDANIFRRIDGTFQVPNYMNGNGDSGQSLRMDPYGMPITNGSSFTAPFRCIIPYAATTGGAAPAVPARISLYGHGLLGEHEEVTAGNVRAMSNEHNFVFCATDWKGFSDDDSLFVLDILKDFSRFPAFIDRQHQGMLNQLFLGRLMKHANGFASHTAFQIGGQSMLDTSELFYDGNSQGGILGGVLGAVAQDATRFSLGVPGINYSFLLNRSTDFEDFDVLLTDTYAASTDRNLILSLAQTLWDRTDPNGHVQHLTADPYLGTPAKKVLYSVAYGDHQVAPVTAEIAARSNDTPIHTPALVGGKSPDVTPYYGIDPIPSYPHDGSALVIWDSGNPPPPNTNQAPASITFMNNPAAWALLEPCAKNNSTGDPHGCPRGDADNRTQKSEFLKTGGAVIDVCGGLPCRAQ